MANFFLDSLERLTIATVAESLGLTGPRDAALREGVRIDFKRPNPKTAELDSDAKTSICRATAAFSNTLGGLVFVGVREEDHYAREIVGVARKGELKTRLDSVIRAGVAPTPRFTIGVAVMDESKGSERDMAVIRVEEGTWPPYCYSESGRQAIVIRSNDRSTPPTLMELDALYAKRARLLEGWKPGPLPEQPNYPMPSARIVFQPMRPISVLLHRGTDEVLTDAYEKRCMTFGERGIDLSRSGDYTELTTEQFGLSRKWRGYSDGTVVFATEILRSMSDETGQQQKVRAVGLVDLAADLVNASKAAQAVMAELAPVATVKVSLELRLGREQVLNRSIFPGDRGRLVLDASSLEPKNWQADTASAVEQVDVSELADSDKLVARLLIRVLRGTRGANMGLEAFSRSVTSETR
jgi:Putative DNA-binding domain